MARQSNVLVQLFAVQARLLIHTPGSKAADRCAAVRDELLAGLTPTQRTEMELVCGALSFACKARSQRRAA